MRITWEKPRAEAAGTWLYIAGQIGDEPDARIVIQAPRGLAMIAKTLIDVGFGLAEGRVTTGTGIVIARGASGGSANGSRPDGEGPEGGADGHW